MPVYLYEGQHYNLEDGLSNEQAVAKIKTHLGQTEQPKVKSPLDDMEKEMKASVSGALEGLGTVVSGAVGGLLSPVPTALQALNAKVKGEPFDFEKQLAANMEAMTTTPKSEIGQEIAGRAGELVNRYLTPLGPMGAGIAGNLSKMRTPKGVTPAEIKAPVPEPVRAPAAGLLDELSKPAEPVAPKQQLTPMQDMARQLGAEPFAAAEEFTPNAVIGQMVEQLPNFETEARGRVADEAMAKRQAEMEFEVKRQTSLDMGAARRAREEAAPTGFKEWQQEKDTAEQQARLERDTELAQRAGTGEQSDLWEPHANMHRAYEEVFAQTPEGVRPFTFKEFKEILDNLSKEPGTAFQMPEDINAAYRDYLNHPGGGQGDLFGAHEVLQSTSHKTWGELTPQEKAKATRALNKIGPITESMTDRMAALLAEDKDTGITYMRSGFTTEDMLGKIPGIGEYVPKAGVSMLRTPQEAIDFAVKSPDVSQNMVGKAMNSMTKGGIYLSDKLKNPVVSFSVDKLLAADSIARAKISDNVHGTYLTALRRLSNEERLHAKALLDAADMNQREITPELMQKYGLSTNLQDFLGTHQLMMKDVLAQINEARMASGKKPITARVAYSAMSMTGDFRKVVTVEGKTVGVIGADTKMGLAALEQKVLSKYPIAEFSKLQDMTTVTKGKKGSPQAAFMDILDMVGEENPQFAEFLKVLNEIAKDDANNYMGMQKHTMQKKGVFGMEGRKFWESEEQNAKDFFSNQVRYAESAYQWGELAKAAKEVNEVIRNPDVVVKQDNAVRIVEEYMQNALGINPSRVGRAVNELMNSAFGTVGIGPGIPKAMISGMRATANTFMLSLSPVFLGMQVIQAPTVMPALTAYLRGRGMAPTSTWLTQGFGHFTQGGWTLTKNLLGKELSGIEKGALDYAKKNHVYATDMVEHANQIEKGVGFYTTKVTQTPAAIVEQSTRAQVYMALVHMLDDSGLKPVDGLYEQAHRFTDMAMVNYGTLEKPAIYNSLGPIGSLAYNLKSFTHNELSRWSMYAREIAETKNPTPLLTQMATTIAVAGVFGLPFYSQFEELYDFITRKLGKPRSLTLDVMEASKQFGKNLGPDAQFALSNGAPTMLGVDLSTRLGLGDVIPSSAAEAAFAGGGKLFEMVKATGRAAVNPSEKNLKSAAINLAPPVLQGPMDVAWYQKGDIAMSKNPEKPPKGMARRNATDVLLKKIGLTGINESSQKQQAYQQDQLDRAYAAYRTDAMNDISWALLNNNKLDQKLLDKYFKVGQGDAATFQRDLESAVKAQGMTQQEAAIIRSAASQRVPQIQSLVRRTQ